MAQLGASQPSHKKSSHATDAPVIDDTGITSKGVAVKNSGALSIRTIGSFASNRVAAQISITDTIQVCLLIAIVRTPVLFVTFPFSEIGRTFREYETITPRRYEAKSPNIGNVPHIRHVQHIEEFRCIGNFPRIRIIQRIGNVQHIEDLPCIRNFPHIRHVQYIEDFPRNSYDRCGFTKQ